MARPLTARQQQVYEFIHDRIIVRGYSPTVREIGEFVGIKSPNGVMCHLRALERKGMIVRVANKSRAIEIASPSDEAPPAPTAILPVGTLAVRGCVAEGACELFEAPQAFDVIEALQRTERYLLQYSGSEFSEYSIADGDMLVIEPTDECKPEVLQLVQSLDGLIELKAPQADNEVAYSSQVIGSVVGVLRIHRPSAIKPPHMQRRKAQRA